MNDYYCTCQFNRDVKKQRYTDHKRYHLTEVDSEGICKYCGYYAVARPPEKYCIYPVKFNWGPHREVSDSLQKWTNSLGLEKFSAWKGESGVPYRWGQTKLPHELVEKEREKDEQERNTKLKRVGRGRS